MRHFIAFLIMLSLPLAAISGDWITGGGNAARNGLSDEIGPNSAAILWQVSSPAWFGNQIMIEGDKLVTRRYQSPYTVPIYCYNLYTGNLLWNLNLPGAFQSLVLGIRDGQVYALKYLETGGNTLYALDADDGSTIWEVDVPELDYFYSPESATFAPNGDVILGDLFHVCRYNHTTGALMWTFNRVGFASGCSEAIASETTVYCWSQTGGIFQIVAVDIETGLERYRVDIDGEAGGPMQQAAPGCIGPDGTIYVHRQGDNITAVEDTGGMMQVLWSTPITGSAPFSYIASGEDGSVYAPIDGAVIRLDGATGAILNTSETISSGTNTKTRYAIGANGTVYVADGESGSAGQLWAFSADLQTLWNVTVNQINDSGPALGPDGTLAVASDGYVMVYQTIPTVTVTLTPYNPPIMIPASGGTFDFGIELMNNDFLPQYFDAWIMVQLPNGSWFGPVLGPLNLTLQAGQSLQRDRMQNVPGNAPAGSYTYEGRVGTYPDDIWDASSFTFEKSATGDGITVDDWFCDGDDFGETINSFSEFPNGKAGAIPTTDELVSIYPNPFNPTAAISFKLQDASYTNLKIFDLQGREVATLVDGFKDAGMHEVTFNATGLAAGVYVYNLTYASSSAGQKHATHVGKLLLVK